MQHARIAVGRLAGPPADGIIVGQEVKITIEGEIVEQTQEQPVARGANA
jgi:hypothetical protein